MIHKLLKRQLRKAFGPAEAVPEALQPLLALIDETYRQADAERLLLERSLELTSQELLELNRQLRRDVAERTLAQARLSEQQHEFRELIDRMPFGVAVRRGDAFILVNPRLVELLGYGSAEELQGPSVLGLVHAADRRLAQARMTELPARGRRPSATLYRLLRKDGTVVPLDVWAVQQLGFDGGPAELLVALDQSEREQMAERLLFADRMASVGTLAAGVAHEINNPLAYLIANLAFVSDELAAVGPGRELPLECRRALEEAQQGAERVRHIVRDLRTFSRSDEERRGAVDVGLVLESSLAMAANEVRHRARVVKEYGDVPPVHANEGRLGQVFLNLLINAAHAIPEGASAQHEIRLTLRMHEGFVAVEIRDSGVGMTEALRRRIFDPFFTTKPIGVGTGLGLSICHGIVSALGGDIEVSSEEGVGSTFRVLLPPSASLTPHGPEELRLPVALGAGRRGRVLVIDDEPMIGATVRRALAPAHEVAVVTSGMAALARLALGESFDVIFCDLMMPGLSGMELYAQLASTQPEAAKRVIFLTGGAFTPGAREFLQAVPNPCVDKPFDVASLAALVRDRISGA